MKPPWVTHQGSPQMRGSQRAWRAVKVTGEAFVSRRSVLTDRAPILIISGKKIGCQRDKRQHRCIDRDTCWLLNSHEKNPIKVVDFVFGQGPK